MAEQGQWPWSRNKLAQMVDGLFDYYQVDLLAFDIAFSEPDNTTPLAELERLAHRELAGDAGFQATLQALKPRFAYDDIFAGSLKNRPVVLSFFTNLQAEAINPENALPLSLGSTTNQAFAASIPKAESYGANLQMLQKTAAGAGYFNNPMVDQDGVYRRIPLLTQYDGQIYEAFALAVYRQALGSSPVNFITEDSYDSQNTVLEGIRVLDYTIPTNADSSILVPYRGPQKSFAYYSATDILNKTIDKNLLAHKIVLVGTTAAGLMDLRSTPVQNVYPGVEIHANIVSALLDRQIKSKPAYMLAFEWLELLLIGLFGIALFSVLSPLGNALLFLGMGLTITGGNLYLWTEADIDSFLATPLLLLSLLFFNQFTFGYFLESRRKKHLSKIFGLYIPPELVNQMVKSGQQFNVTGESRQMTVLFSDIRGFSSISENLEPHDLCELINEILSPVTQVIHQNHGTIDKYIGDAVMAFWGAPLDDRNHASHAIGSALAILPVLEEINWRFSLRGWPEIKIGIGVNTGKMSVGNMGSNFRMAYTVMGDAVNLGSRLEGLTKIYGVPIIVSQTSKQQAPEFIYRELDRVTVKGKSASLSIYQPLGKQGEVDRETLEQLPKLEQAMKLYRRGYWLEAEQAFQRLSRQNPEDLLYRMYLRRIESFKDYSPGESWDGVYEHTDK